MITAPVLALSLTGVGLAASHATGRHGAKAGHEIGYDGGPARAGDDGGALMDRAAEYTGARTAPGTTVSAQALLAARQHAAAMPVRAGSWAERTTAPYNAEPAGFTDPFSPFAWSLLSFTFDWIAISPLSWRSCKPITGSAAQSMVTMPKWLP